MKEKRDFLQSISPTNTEGIMHLLNSPNRGVFDKPLDDEITRISEMSIEKIKDELAQMGALDIPIPKLSTISQKRKFPLVYSFVFRAIKFLADQRRVSFIWLKGKLLTSHTPINGLLAAVIIVVGILSFSYLMVAPEVPREHTGSGLAKAGQQIKEQNNGNSVEEVPTTEIITPDFIQGKTEQAQNREKAKAKGNNRTKPKPTNANKPKPTNANKPKQNYEITYESHPVQGLLPLNENKQTQILKPTLLMGGILEVKEKPIINTDGPKLSSNLKSNSNDE